jgi:hypothetical protein
MSSRYGKLFQIEDLGDDRAARVLQQIDLNGNKAETGYDEGWLQKFLGDHPQALPIVDIEPVMDGAVPVCRELETPSGWIDLLLVSPRGDIVVTECKLWRNPQARREVVGQIIDYAKALSHFSYEEFEAAIRKAEPSGGIHKGDTLYHRTGAGAAGVDEPTFIDAVSRNLRLGRFLLLIVGDGIREGVQGMAEFLQQHAGMHFTFALVEIAIFKSHPAGYLVQPRILAKTATIQRGVVSIEDGCIKIAPPPAPVGPGASQGIRTTQVPATISEARLYESLEAKLPGGADRLRGFLARLGDLDVPPPRLTPSLIVVEGRVADQSVVLGRVDAANAQVWFDGMIAEATSRGYQEAALTYYRTLASLLRDPDQRATKLDPKTKTGTALLPLEDLLIREEDWKEAVRTYLSAVAEVSRSQS